MTITDNTITENVWTDVRAALVAASITATSATSTDTFNISATYPDNPGNKPYIIINPPIVEESEFKFGGLQGRKSINVLIDIVGPKTYQLQQGMDQVRATLINNAISGIDLIGISMDYAFQAPGQQKYKLASITASYLRE